MNFVVLDTETTGLDSPIQAVEVGFLVIDENLKVLKEVGGLVRPTRCINPGATEIHGITDEMVLNAPTMQYYVAGLPTNFVAIGHNVGFDLRVLANDIMWSAEVCTLALSRRWIKNTSNHKLPTLKKELGLSEQVSHSAIGDCYTCLEVLKKALQLSGRTLPELVALEQQPKMLPSMPFGKYRGRKFTEIPTSYITWMLDLPDLHKDIRYTIDKLALIRGIK